MPPALKASTFGDYVASVPPEQDWIVENLVPNGGLTVLLAKPKTGKSILAAQLAEALALGTSLLGRRVVKPRRPLYVQLDATPRDWRKQLRQLGFTVAETLDVQQVPRFFLDSMVERQRLGAYIRNEGFDFLIWDALEKLTQADLNPTPGMQVALTRLQTVFDGPRLLIHHPRKPGGDGGGDSIVDAGSGSKYLTGEASAIWLLERVDKLKGKITLRGRDLDETAVPLARDPETYLWLLSKPPVSRPLATDDLKWTR